MVLFESTLTAAVRDQNSYEPVHSVQRALLLLRALNRRRVSSLDRLHVDTGLPKPTIVQMLETLMTEGHVTRDKRQGGYLVTSMVQSLSCGFHGDPLVVEAARPWALAVTKRCQWPVSIAVLDEEEMVVRFSTVRDSPISPEHATINMRLNLTDRAMGLCYLAFCPDAERTILLGQLETRHPLALQRAGGRKLFEERLAGIRRQGYALRSVGAEPLNSGTLALPIVYRGRILATLGLGYFRTAVPPGQVIDEYVPMLRGAVDGIELQIAALTEGVAVQSLS